MTLPYEKKQLDAAKARQVPLFKLDLDYRHVKKAPFGMISRVGLLTAETADAIMKLIDADPAAQSDAQLERRHGASK